MNVRNPALFARIFNTPLMILPSKLDAIIGGIGQRFGIDDQPQTDMALINTGERRRPGYEVIGDIAVVKVFGILAHRGYYTADSSYILGYDMVGRRIQSAVEDPGVKAILLEMDSPGGEVAGAFELAQQIREWNAVKPIYSSISNLSASANYLLASATSEIGITDTSMAGSIGVAIRHVDISKMAEKEGVTVKHIFAGARKVDGNQFEPLSEEVEARFQAEVDFIYDLFVNAVSQDRKLKLESIRNQEAAVYTGVDAIEAGLADRIITPDQMLAEMQQLFQKPNRGLSMSTSKQEPDDQAELLKQAEAQGYDKGKNDGLAEGATAERTRITTILNHEAAEGREAQAKALALDTDLNPEAAAKVLAVSPKAEKPQAGNAFAQHMAALGNPDVGPDNGDDNGQDDQKAAIALIIGGKQ